MRLRQLRYFIGVADAGSFSKASGVLHIAQPALSNQIGALENELDLRLLDRHSRGVELTPAGRHLLERAKEIVSLVDDTRASLRKFKSTKNVEIYIGLPTTTTGIVTLPLIEAISLAYPSVNLHIVEGMTGHLEKWLDQSDLDAAILFSDPDDRHYSVRQIGQERLVVVGRMRGEFLGRESVRFSEVAELPIIHSTAVHQLRRMIDQMAARIKRPIRYVSEIDSLAQINIMVRAGLGYTILPARYAATGWSSPEIHTWDIEESPTDGFGRCEIGINLVSSPSFMYEKYSDGFLDELEATVRRLIKSGQWPGAVLKR